MPLSTAPSGIATGAANAALVLVRRDSYGISMPSRSEMNTITRPSAVSAGSRSLALELCGKSTWVSNEPVAVARVAPEMS